jgi:hypothetical protein
MSRITRSRAKATAVAVFLALGLAGCATKSINRIMAEPSRYNNRDVTIKGRVVKSASVLGHGSYQIDDGTGTLWVVSKKGVPRKGAHVKVTGKIRDVVDLGSVLPLPPEVGSGLVMTESHHKASY